VCSNDGLNDPSRFLQQRKHIQRWPQQQIPPHLGQTVGRIRNHSKSADSAMRFNVQGGIDVFVPIRPLSRHPRPVSDQ
jgi:hypothetical protein